MTEFKNQALKELTEQQTRYAPPARRQAQVANAQKLLAEIEPGKAYPYQYVCFRVTDYRSDAYPDLRDSPATILRHDLALFIRRVERSVPPLPIEQAVEPMLTLEEVSKRFNVSTKTISRWRVKGLAARRVKVNGRSQLGFPTAAVEKFVAEHKVLVEKGARFSHLTDAEKDDILRAGTRTAGCRGDAHGGEQDDRDQARAQPGGRAVHDQELRPGSPGSGTVPARRPAR